MARGDGSAARRRRVVVVRRRRGGISSIGRSGIAQSLVDRVGDQTDDVGGGGGWSGGGAGDAPDGGGVRMMGTEEMTVASTGRGRCHFCLPSYCLLSFDITA